MSAKTAQPQVPARRFTDSAGEPDTVIGPGISIQGEIKARSVAIAEGSYFEGKVHMTHRQGGDEPTTFREARTSAGAPEEAPADKG